MFISALTFTELNLKPHPLNFKVTTAKTSCDDYFLKHFKDVLSSINIHSSCNLAIKS